MGTKVKICGLTRLEDARLAVELGAWALGLIFYRRSPRRCKLGDAEVIAAELKRDAEICGVFVNAKLEEVAEKADRVGLSMVQLHGDEGPVFCAEVARKTGCKVIKAARVRSAADVRALQAYHTDFHLYDSHTRGVRGGSGSTFDWSLLSQHSGIPLILSGGLNPINVAAGMTAVKPFAVDVASGVESGPGIKDQQKLSDFFAATHATQVSSG